MKNYHSVLLSLCLVGFIDSIDATLMIPLGPDLAKDLGFSVTQISWLIMTDAISAIIAALIGAKCLDRFERKKVLLTFLSGLCIANFLTGFAWNLNSLMISRALAGACGGMTVTLIMTIITDVFPPQRRGQAMGIVFMAAPLAGITAIPFALWLSHDISWQWVFWSLSATIFLSQILAYRYLPNLDTNISASNFSLSNIVSKPLLGLGIIYTAFKTMPGVLLGIHLSAILQFNYHITRDDLYWVFLIVGIVSIISTPLAGRINDRIGSLKTFVVGTAFTLLIIQFWFVTPLPIPILMILCLYTAVGPFCDIPPVSINSQIPDDNERAAFYALKSIFMHAGVAIASFVSYKILIPDNDGALLNLDKLAILIMVLTVVELIFLVYISRKLKSIDTRNLDDALPDLD